MALTFRGDGTGAAFLVNSGWWNDYYNLLTGTMTDQPITLKYAPGASGATPVLKLQSNGNAPFLSFVKNDGTTVALAVDYSGNLTSAGTSLALGGTGGSPVQMGWDSAGTGNAFLKSALAGASDHGIYFQTWKGGATKTAFSVGYQASGALAWVDGAGNLLGSGTTSQFGDKLVGSGASDAGLVTSTQVAVLGGTSAVLKANNYYDGASDRYVASSRAVQFNPATGPAYSGPGWRYDTGSRAAGGAITWSAWQNVALLRSAGGGTAGGGIWVGTTDPGSSAAEGDLWAVG